LELTGTARMVTAGGSQKKKKSNAQGHLKSKVRQTEEGDRWGSVTRGKKKKRSLTLRSKKAQKRHK